MRAAGIAALPVRPLLRRLSDPLQIETRELASPRVTASLEGFRIGFLSDLHAGRITPVSALAGAIDAMCELGPDLVLLGGDYVDTSRQYARPVANLLARLHAPFGVYAVLGNHDYRAGIGAVVQALSDNGVHILVNTGRQITPGLFVGGVDDLREGSPDVARALAGRASGDLALLLSHNPDLSVRVDPRDVDLMLSGHTHGGQIRVRGRALVTHSRHGSHFLEGFCRLGGCRVYVSRGVGCVAVPMRRGSPPEVTVFRLTRASGSGDDSLAHDDSEAAKRRR